MQSAGKAAKGGAGRQEAWLRVSGSTGQVGTEATVSWQGEGPGLEGDRRLEEVPAAEQARWPGSGQAATTGS